MLSSSQDSEKWTLGMYIQHMYSICKEGSLVMRLGHWWCQGALLVLDEKCVMHVQHANHVVSNYVNVHRSGGMPSQENFELAFCNLLWKQFLFTATDCSLKRFKIQLYHVGCNIGISVPSPSILLCYAFCVHMWLSCVHTYVQWDNIIGMIVRFGIVCLFTSNYVHFDKLLSQSTRKSSVFVVCCIG